MESYGEEDANYVEQESPDDRSCPHCGGPMDHPDDGDCGDQECRNYQRRQECDADSAGWGCSPACGWCGRCA